MSLNSIHLPKSVQCGNVYAIKGSCAAINLHDLLSAVACDFKKFCEFCMPYTNESLWAECIRHENDMHAVYNLISSYFSSELHCPRFALCIAPVAFEKCKHFKPVHLNIPADKFRVLTIVDGIALVIADGSTAQQSDGHYPGAPIISPNLNKLLADREGYALYRGAKNIPSFSEFMSLETRRRDGFQVYAELALERAESLQFLERFLENMGKGITITFRDLNSQIVESLSSSLGTDISNKPCIRMCSKEELQYLPEDINYVKVSLEGEIYPILRETEFGALIVADRIVIPSEEPAKETSLFSDRGENHVVVGKPTYEYEQFMFAITKDSFVSLYGKEPQQADESTKYPGLYLTDLVPHAPVFDRMSDINLLEVTYNDFGVVNIHNVDNL